MKSPLNIDERRALLATLGVLGGNSSGVAAETVVRALVGLGLCEPTRTELRRFLFRNYDLVRSVRTEVADAFFDEL